MERKSFAAFIPSGIAFATWMAVSAATTLAARFPELLPSDPAAPPARSAEGPHALAAFFSPQVLAWEPEILRWSSGFGLDPDLVATVMQIESCGDRNAVSRSGAQGLFQVMPFHFSAGEDKRNPEVNARWPRAGRIQRRPRRDRLGGVAVAGGNAPLRILGRGDIHRCRRRTRPQPASGGMAGGGRIFFVRGSCSVKRVFSPGLHGRKPLILWIEMEKNNP
jgi:hypothetical protein